MGGSGLNIQLVVITACCGYFLFQNARLLVTEPLWGGGRRWPRVSESSVTCSYGTRVVVVVPVLRVARLWARLPLQALDLRRVRRRAGGESLLEEVGDVKNLREEMMVKSKPHSINTSGL